MKETDTKTDISAVIDRHEDVSSMQPVLISQDSRHRAKLTDLVVELTNKSARFRGSLPTRTAEALSELVLSMNCYYSNLIEGHDTHPRDIERSLRNDYSNDVEKRNLQKEARAHIECQRWIDAGNLHGRSLTVDAIIEVHERFCSQLPEDMLFVEHPTTNEKLPVVPGAFRVHDVEVGAHHPVSPGAVPRFMDVFEKAHLDLGVTDKILAAATSHHRLLWIHPFLDGNGRVARLISHALLLETLDTAGLWSISRGLARNVQAYKSHLHNCDLPRRNPLDGRGALSEEKLAEFAEFFLEICIDQVTFMEDLMQPRTLSTRIQFWAEEQIRLGVLPANAMKLLDAVLSRGVLLRAEIPELLGVTDRHARRSVQALNSQGIIQSETQRAPIRLAFPATLADRLFPALFPDQVSPQRALSYEDAALANQLRLTKTLRDIATRFKVSRDDVQQAIADYQSGDKW